MRETFMASGTWRLVDLGAVDPYETQAIYEAIGVARSRGLVPDTIVFCQPRNQLVCIGYHQELESEIDLEYCERNRIPIVRRILGGGAVILDSGQQFYQLIASRNNPTIPYGVEDAYAKILAALVRAYRALGIPAEYRAINDVQVRGKKISGNGATVLDDVLIMTGNMILDFDYDTMCNVLKVPSEKFKDKLVRNLREWVTTIRKEIGTLPSLDDLKKILRESFEEELSIGLVPGKLLGHEKAMLEQLVKKYQSKEWLLGPQLEHHELVKKRAVKITGRVRIGEGNFKAKGGLIRVLLEADGDLVSDIMLTGDFWFYPKEKLILLERKLRGVKLDTKILSNTIYRFYREEGIESPGVSPEDVAAAIELAS